MKPIFKYIYTLIFLASLHTTAQNEIAIFNQANTLYNEGNFNEAITNYERIISNGKHSAEVYFNLANAYYKLNKIAPSIYNYEKALLLNPNNKDIKNNLAFAQNMTIDDIDVLPEVGLSKIIKNISNRFSFEVWSYASVFFSILFVLLILWYYFTFSTSKKRLAFILSTFSLFLILVTLAFAFKKYNIDTKTVYAIVFSEESKVKTEPNLRSEQAFKLHEGTKVQVLETINNWKHIKLANGKTGWLPMEDIKLLTFN